ncbi:alpha/beta-hydrolase [Aureobasidium sp. EXF-3400]|nr:alpha/beta-hydrolase [Aureobasidium sp. EXF-12344]KAI4779842.1 alpha/beta-hydrolase [Aureobasidium sp. EXF-3400]
MTDNPSTINHSIINHDTIQLPTKPSANLSYTFLPGAPTTTTLVIFLNGLILPQSSWYPTISATQTKFLHTEIARPHLLSYDRYGQGTSDAHPNGSHDILEVVSDLHTFLNLFCSQKLNCKLAELKVMLVCNSIGCAIARLYCDTNPATSSGLIFLDSIMAHIDLVALWPDVDATGFDRATLPEGTTVEEIRGVREQHRQRFHASVPNPEGLDRRNLAQLLPSAQGPRLQGTLLTVVGHDPETFAQENEKSFGVRQALVMEYVNPVWHEYNKGLASLTDRDKSQGPVIAKGCGHFIQRDDPEFVATEIYDLLQRLEEA